jgi:mRNA interferase RelE/StbE
VNLIRTERFVRAYRALQPDLRDKVNKALGLLAVDPGHPSLRLKKMRGKAAVWEARVDRSYRLTLEIRDDSFLLRTVGKHDETLARP